MIRNRPECFKAEYKTAAKNIWIHDNFTPSRVKVSEKFVQ